MCRYEILYGVLIQVLLSSALTNSFLLLLVLSFRKIFIIVFNRHLALANGLNIDLIIDGRLKRLYKSIVQQIQDSIPGADCSFIKCAADRNFGCYLFFFWV